MRVPTLLVGGWQDLFFEQTMAQYRALKTSGTDVALTVGPWTHVHTATKAAGEIAREGEEWLAQHLRLDQSKHRDSAVRVFVTGAETWRSYDAWPPAATELTLYTSDSQTLADAPGKGASAFTYDPSDPTPAVGGRLLSPRQAGVKDNAILEKRADVLTFTGAVLQADLEIIGEPVLEISLSVDNPYADLFARLCDVDARGKSRNFSDGFVRLDPKVPAGQIQNITLQLDPCAHRLAAGHRLRLVLGGGAHPRFARNLGTGEPLATGRSLVPSVHTVHHGSTRVVIPAGTSR